jgi:hypothetical protein
MARKVGHCTLLTPPHDDRKSARETLAPSPDHWAHNAQNAASGESGRYGKRNRKCHADPHDLALNLDASGRRWVPTVIEVMQFRQPAIGIRKRPWPVARVILVGIGEEPNLGPVEIAGRDDADRETEPSCGRSEPSQHALILPVRRPERHHATPWLPPCSTTCTISAGALMRSGNQLPTPLLTIRALLPLRYRPDV